jgi:hypothetical protein
VDRLENRPTDGSRNQRPSAGLELRVYIGGDFHYSRAHPTCELAEAEAEERKRELLAEGWTDKPILSE